MMKKRSVVLILFVVYVAILFLLALQYESRAQDQGSKLFFGGLGESIRYLFISFLISSAFLIIAFFIHNKLSFLFIPLAPFLNIGVAFVVGLVLNLVLWITRLEDAISFILQAFLIATISTMGTTYWLLGGMFKNDNQKRGMRVP